MRCGFFANVGFVGYDMGKLREKGGDWGRGRF